MIGTHKPFRASALNILRVVVLLIPFTVIGSHFFKLEGIFWGRFMTDMFAGSIGIWWSGSDIVVKVGTGCCSLNCRLSLPEDNTGR